MVIQGGVRVDHSSSTGAFGVRSYFRGVPSGAHSSSAADFPFRNCPVARPLGSWGDARASCVQPGASSSVNWPDKCHRFRIPFYLTDDAYKDHFLSP